MAIIDLTPRANELEPGVCDYRFHEPIAAGWYLFTCTVASQDGVKPKLIFDWGEGASPPSACPLGPAKNGTYELLVQIQRAAHGVKIHCDDLNGAFASVRLTCAPLGGLGVLRYLARLLARAFVSWPPGRRLAAFKSLTQPDGTALRVVRPFRLRSFGMGARGYQARRRDDYARWIGEHDYDHPRDAPALRQALEPLSSKPLFSILMPVYRPPPELLDKAIRSVVDQVYDQWELCVADDGSKAAEVRELLERWARQDPRIKVTFRSQNGHISAATNTAFDELATGNWVVLLDHDDELTPNALAELALAINRSPNAQLIYSDEDKIDETGMRFDPYFKPQYSPELFRCQNYLNHLTALRASAVRQVGGWREGFEGAQDYDLYFRVVEQTRAANIVHIPKILYHWRTVEGSAAASSTAKEYAVTAGAKARAEHFERSGLAYHITPSSNGAHHRTVPDAPDPEPLVTILIPTRDGLDVLRPCVESILDKTTYANFEIVIVDNDSTDPATLSFLDEVIARDNVHILRYPGPFNFSALNNYAVSRARGSLVALLNNDLEVIGPDWLTNMVAWAVQPDIGCVGAKLYYPDDTVQHAGVALGIGGVAGHVHKGAPRAASGYFGHLQVVRTVSAVTAACLVVRKAVYEEAGGLDEERLAVAFNDVDFCLTVSRLGYRHVWTPVAELYHKESHSRGYEDTPEKQERYRLERAHMQEKWGQALANDPYYSPNLTLKREDLSYR